MASFESTAHFGAEPAPTHRERQDEVYDSAFNDRLESLRSLNLDQLAAARATLDGMPLPSFEDPQEQLFQAQRDALDRAYALAISDTCHAGKTEVTNEQREFLLRDLANNGLRSAYAEHIFKGNGFKGVRDAAYKLRAENITVTDPDGNVVDKINKKNLTEEQPKGAFAKIGKFASKIVKNIPGAEKAIDAMPPFIRERLTDVGRTGAIGLASVGLLALFGGAVAWPVVAATIGGSIIGRSAASYFSREKKLHRPQENGVSIAGETWDELQNTVVSAQRNAQGYFDRANESGAPLNPEDRNQLRKDILNGMIGGLQNQQMEKVKVFHDISKKATTSEVLWGAAGGILGGGIMNIAQGMTALHQAQEHGVRMVGEHLATNTTDGHTVKQFIDGTWHVLENNPAGGGVLTPDQIANLNQLAPNLHVVSSGFDGAHQLTLQQFQQYGGLDLLHSPVHTTTFNIFVELTKNALLQSSLVAAGMGALPSMWKKGEEGSLVAQKKDMATFLFNLTDQHQYAGHSNMPPGSAIFGQHNGVPQSPEHIDREGRISQFEQTHQGLRREWTNINQLLAGSANQGLHPFVIHAPDGDVTAIPEQVDRIKQIHGQNTVIHAVVSAAPSIDTQQRVYDQAARTDLSGLASLDIITSQGDPKVWAGYLKDVMDTHNLDSSSYYVEIPTPTTGPTQPETENERRATLFERISAIEQRLEQPAPKVQVIGDVHGAADHLEQIIDPNAERIIFLGDYIDRGHHSLRVLEQVKGLVDADKADILIGNHEAKFLAAMEGDDESMGAWLNNGGDEFRREAGAASSQAEIRSNPELVKWAAWLREHGQLFATRDGVAYVHGGIPMDPNGQLKEFHTRDGQRFSGIAGLRAMQQDLREGRIAYSDIALDTENTPFCAGRRDGSPDRYEWYDRVPDPEAVVANLHDPERPDYSFKRIVFGHTPNRSGRINNRGNGRLLGIDAGMTDRYGGHGGSLFLDGEGVRFQSRDLQEEEFNPVISDQKRAVSETDQGIELLKELEQIRQEVASLPASLPTVPPTTA